MDTESDGRLAAIEDRLDGMHEALWGPRHRPAEGIVAKIDDVTVALWGAQDERRRQAGERGLVGTVQELAADAKARKTIGRFLISLLSLIGVANAFAVVVFLVNALGGGR